MESSGAEIMYHSVPSNERRWWWNNIERRVMQRPWITLGFYERLTWTNDFACIPIVVRESGTFWADPSAKVAFRSRPRNFMRYTSTTAMTCYQTLGRKIWSSPPLGPFQVLHFCAFSYGNRRRASGLSMHYKEHFGYMEKLGYYWDKGTVSFIARSSFMHHIFKLILGSHYETSINFLWSGEYNKIRQCSAPHNE